MSPRTEGELLQAVQDLATRCQWAIHHDRPARRAGAGWATHIAGHAGFPDLVLARRGVVLFRELKGYDRNGRMGRLSSEQRDWTRQLDPTWAPHAAFAPFPQVVSGRGADHPKDMARLRAGLLFDVWTPDDWDLIVATLTAKTRVP